MVQANRQAGIPKDPFGIVAIGIWLCVADAARGRFQLRATKALQEGVWPLLLLQQAPVCPFPQSHHQAHQSDTHTQQTHRKHTSSLKNKHHV